MEKRGQSRILVYVIITVVAVFILYLGYSIINSVVQEGDQVVLIQFKTKLGADTEAFSSDIGSVEINKYKLPSNYDEICFVDLEDIDPSFLSDYPLIRDSVESGVEKNIFLIGAKGQESFYVEDFQLYFPNFFCLDAKGKIVELKMTNRFGSIIIKAPVSRDYCQNAEDTVLEPPTATNPAVTLCAFLDYDFAFGPGYKDECCNRFALCC